MQDKINLMVEKAREARARAYNPYSKFYVGSCVEAEDGTLYTGCNFENASYSLTVCAEVCAISNMIAAGKKKIKSIAVIGTGKGVCTPCGACRQIIREFAAPDTPVYLCDGETGKFVEMLTIEQMLPMSFGPNNLEYVEQ
jgi:cytidine deaminase